MAILFSSALIKMRMLKKSAMCKTDFEGCFYTDFYTVWLEKHARTGQNKPEKDKFKKLAEEEKIAQTRIKPRKNQDKPR